MILEGTTENASVGAALLGLIVGFLVMRVAIRSAPDGLMRTNVDGRKVPAVLGAPIAAGGLVGVLWTAVAPEVVDWVDPIPTRLCVAAALILVVMTAAGAWDDRRGDERPRGFRGHLGALRGGRLTGGMVKLVAGGIVGLAAGRVLTSDLATVLEVGALVALTSNLINLVDRAPGRAAKVSLLLALLPFGLGPEPWWSVAAGTFGALLVCLPADLSARAMLGDAGANPIGGILGLGFALMLTEPGRLVAIGVLVLLNLASEKWSFSKLIERSAPLRAFDMWGRPRGPG